MSIVRSAQVAGMFFPEDPNELKMLVKRCFDAALGFGKKEIPPKRINIPKVIISPHAGLSCSGIIAAKGYASLLQSPSSIRRVIVWGPSHRYPVRDMAVTVADYYATPLGDIALDHDVTRQLLIGKTVRVVEQAFDVPENSLETQMPFLQTVLTNFTMVPVLIGLTSPETVAEVMEAVWGDSDTLFVISSDLSHYHDYETAKRIDQKTIQSILQLKPDQVGDEQACGLTGIQAMLHIAKRKKLDIELIGYCNSGDTIGSRDQVVGYAAFHLFERE